MNFHVVRQESTLRFEGKRFFFKKPITNSYLCQDCALEPAERDFFRFAQKIPGGRTVPKTLENQSAFGVLFFIPIQLKEASFVRI